MKRSAIRQRKVPQPPAIGAERYSLVCNDVGDDLIEARPENVPGLRRRIALRSIRPTCRIRTLIGTGCMKQRLSRRAVAIFCVWLAIAPVHAQSPGSGILCHQIADRIRADLMPVPVRQQELLDGLAALPDGFLTLTATERSRGSLGVDLLRARGAPEALIAKVGELEASNLELIHLHQTDIWLLDHVEGTAYCHVVVAVSIPPSGRAAELRIPPGSDPTGACGTTLAAAVVNGATAILLEDDSPFTTDFSRSRLTVIALHDAEFDPPCEVDARYALTFRTQNAFCNVGSLDCALLIRRADDLAGRRDAGETADSLGAGVSSYWSPKDSAEYSRMEDLARGTGDAQLPTFGGYTLGMTTFQDDVTFPILLDDGRADLARLGHGHLGWRETPDYLMAVYRLDNGQLTPVAGLSIEALRSRIVSVEAR